MGAIGASIAGRLVTEGWTVTGIDLDSDGSEPEVGPGSEAGEEIATADLIVLATPYDAIMSWLDRVVTVANPGALVLDVGGAKRAIVDAMRLAAEDSAAPLLVGGHPMAGTHVAGMKGARSDLLDDAIWALTPVGTQRDDQAIERAAAIVRSLGGKPAMVSAGTHDAWAARVSHLPFMNGLALLAIGSSGSSTIAGPGFRGATRVAANGSVEMWTQVLGANADEVARAVDEMMVGLQQLRDIVHDPEQMTRVIRAIRVAALRHGDR
jgi:prephenate dehydrogenase